jgi:hypothetical protein
MESWYRDKLKGDEVVLLSESGFTSDDLVWAYLQHLILCTGVTPRGPYILLLITITAAIALLRILF